MVAIGNSPHILHSFSFSLRGHECEAFFGAGAIRGRFRFRDETSITFSDVLKTDWFLAAPYGKNPDDLIK